MSPAASLRWQGGVAAVRCQVCVSARTAQCCACLHWPLRWEMSREQPGPLLPLSSLNVGVSSPPRPTVQAAAVHACARMIASGACFGHTACINALTAQLKSLNDGARVACAVTLAQLCPRAVLAGADEEGLDWNAIDDDASCREADVVTVHSQVMSSLHTSTCPCCRWPTPRRSLTAYPSRRARTPALWGLEVASPWAAAQACCKP